MKKVLLLMAVFVFIRSINFVPGLNFSTDPALFSSRAREIFLTRKPVLIGPTFSINLNGRYAFQGAVIYYFQLGFLILGNFDPVISSYLFMLFCAAMTIPLYEGVRKLSNERTALAAGIIYTLLPFYINYTKFLWNPNFQLALSPAIVYLAGRYAEKKKSRILFLTGGAGGIVVQFHYQFLAVLAGLTIYFLVTAEKKFKNMAIWFAGLAVGFSPMIAFELRHSFYNLQTILLFFRYRSSVGNNPVGNLNDYYFLSISFFAVLLILSVFRNRKWPTTAVFITLLILDLAIYLPVPKEGFRMSRGWKYEDELKAHEIIKNTGIKSFNVANLVYDPKAITQKYLLEKDGIAIDEEDYKDNQYLFVLSSNKDFLSDPAYEISALRPATVINEWQINREVNLYLARRSQPVVLY
jgi:hypothetical protein